MDDTLAFDPHNIPLDAQGPLFELIWAIQSESMPAPVAEELCTVRLIERGKSASFIADAMNHARWLLQQYAQAHRS